MRIKVKYNDGNEDDEKKDELYCVCCKERINLGEKYIIVLEEDGDEIIQKPYHLDHVPEDDEEVYICKEEDME